MSWKQRKGTPRVSTWNVLNWATRAVTLTSRLNFDAKLSTSLEVSSPLPAFVYFLLETPPPPPGSASLGYCYKKIAVGHHWDLKGQEILIKSSWMDSSVSHLQLYMCAARLKPRRVGTLCSNFILLGFLGILLLHKTDSSYRYNIDICLLIFISGRNCISVFCSGCTCQEWTRNHSYVHHQSWRCDMVP